MNIDLGVLLLGFMMGFVSAKIWLLGMNILSKRRKDIVTTQINLAD